MIRRLLKLAGMVFLEDEQLRELARERCEEEGWSWTEPVTLQHGPVITLVTTNSEMRGGNVRVAIDARSGQIVEAGFANR